MGLLSSSRDRVMEGKRWMKDEAEGKKDEEQSRAERQKEKSGLSSRIVARTGTIKRIGEILGIDKDGGKMLVRFSGERSCRGDVVHPPTSHPHPLAPEGRLLLSGVLFMSLQLQTNLGSRRKHGR